MNKIGVYIDTNDLYKSLKHNGSKQLDYEKLMGHIQDMGKVVDAIAYGNESSDEASEFKCMLHKIGITPKYKKIQPNSYFSWNTTIIVDIVRHLPELDVVVLCSGDGDLTPIINHIVSIGKKIIVIACRPSQSMVDRATSTIEIYKELLCG